METLTELTLMSVKCENPTRTIFETLLTSTHIVAVHVRTVLTDTSTSTTRRAIISLTANS